MNQNRFTRSSGAGNKKMRPLIQRVGYNFAGNILSDRKKEIIARVRLHFLEDIFERNSPWRLVSNLDTRSRASFHNRFHTNGLIAVEITLKVIGKRCNLICLFTGIRQDIESGDRSTDGKAGCTGTDAEVL